MLPPWQRSRDREGLHQDPGLQAERTTMAWQRTALGVAGVSSLLLHETGGRFLAALPGLFGITMATALLVLSELRYERSTSRTTPASEPVDPRLLLLTALTVSLLAVMAIGLVLIEG